MPTKTGKRERGEVFRQGNTLTCTYNISHAPQLTYREERSSPLRPLQMPVHAPSMPTKTEKEKPGQVTPFKKNPSQHANCAAKHHPKSTPLLHLVPQHDPTRNRDRPRLTRWSRGSFSLPSYLSSCCWSPSNDFHIVRLRY